MGKVLDKIVDFQVRVFKEFIERNPGMRVEG